MILWYQLSSYFVLITIVLFGFQNCSQPDVNLTSYYNDPSILEIKGRICVPQGYKLANLFITNLSAKPHLDSVVIDSDQDGLDDKFEIKSGFNPHDPRSKGPILDGICFYLTNTNDCENLNILCDDQEAENLNEFGLSDCDVNALNLNRVANKLLGIDSDTDGIPDKVELLFGLDPSTDDALGDYDEDGVLNIREIFQNTHPRQASSSKPNSNPLLSQEIPFQNMECDTNEEDYESEWAFLKNQKIYDLNNNPTTKLKENHIWVIAVLEKSINSLRTDVKIKYVHLKKEHFKEKITLNILSSDFMAANENFF